MKGSSNYWWLSFYFILFTTTLFFPHNKSQYLPIMLPIVTITFNFITVLRPRNEVAHSLKHMSIVTCCNHCMGVVSLIHLSRHKVWLTFLPVLRRISSPRTKLLAARCECLHLIKINCIALWLDESAHASLAASCEELRANTGNPPLYRVV
jgi:hypothetical protein